MSERADEVTGGDRLATYKYPAMTKQMGVKGAEDAEGDKGFLLHVEARTRAQGKKREPLARARRPWLVTRACARTRLSKDFNFLLIFSPMALSRGDSLDSI